MKVVKTKIGDLDIFIESVSDDFIEASYGESTSSMIPTSSTEQKLTDSYEEVKILLKTIASDFGGLLNQIEKSNRPEQAELNLNLSISFEVGNKWIITGKSDASINTKFSWSKNDNK